MDKRGFESLEAMHDYMIKQWNSVVRKMMKLLYLVIFHLAKVSNQRNTSQIKWEEVFSEWWT